MAAAEYEQIMAILTLLCVIVSAASMMIRLKNNDCVFVFVFVISVVHYFVLKCYAYCICSSFHCLPLHML